MYEKQTLPNGVRIVYEHMPHVRSAAIGVWVGVGSRYESPCEAGSAHFIEHMLFKGTAQHSASELAERMDAIGGQVNAYTTREGTCWIRPCSASFFTSSTKFSASWFCAPMAAGFR